jgi:hypothetical protein
MGIEMNENDTTVTKPMASSKSRAFIVGLSNVSVRLAPVSVGLDPGLVAWSYINCLISVTVWSSPGQNLGVLYHRHAT